MTAAGYLTIVVADVKSKHIPSVKFCLSPLFCTFSLCRQIYPLVHVSPSRCLLHFFNLVYSFLSLLYFYRAPP